MQTPSFLKTMLFTLLVSFVSVFNLAVANSLDKPSLEQQVPLALEGYDVLTYFDLTGAKFGQDSFQAVYQGKRYLFSNEENQQKFANDPQSFLPQFDGHCAQSVAMKKDMPANPAIYTLEQGKLYMFNDEAAKQEWSRDSQQSLLVANNNWHFSAEKRAEQIGAKNLWKEKNQVKLFSF
jgi:YHS domain-containing protein